MLVSVIVVSWNTRELLRACLTSLLAELDSLPSSEVFLVDNDSADGSADMVAADFPTVRLTANKTNRGFAAANNQALEMASGDFILLLNPDTVVHPGAIKTMIDFMRSHARAGIVAPQLLNSDGSVQRSCRQFPTFLGMLYELLGLSRFFPDKALFRQYKMLDWEHDDERQVDQPEGACLMLRKEVINQVGVLDEGFFMLFEEVDWCYRIKKAGWEIWFAPASKVTHHYGQSIKQVKVKMILSSHRGLYRFWRKHYRGDRWYLDAFAYLGLMTLAYVRIFSYKVRLLTQRA
ncbi:MAG TPA: glycosyltransferase family 2 protein [Oculatellaceae cyanobacterium]